MKYKLSFLIKIPLIILLLSLLSFALTLAVNNNKGFKEQLLDFIKSNERKSDESAIIVKNSIENHPDPEEDDGMIYRNGDWEKHVTSSKYSFSDDDSGGKTAVLREKEKIDFNSYGSIIFDMTYGKSAFTKDRYRRFDEDKPESKVIDGGFNFEREIKLHMEGDMGKRMTVYIDHDSRKENNNYRMQYRSEQDDEVIREINAGEIDISFEHSKYAVYDDTTSKGLGMDMTLKRGDLSVKAFGSVTQGETEVETFLGKSSPDNIKLAEYQYVKDTYFQLEPFRRYDALASAPSASAGNYSSLITFTSNPPYPSGYTPQPVNIDSRSFELYMDDQDPYNNRNSTRLASVDGGYYNRLAAGSDYKINFSTGIITILKNIPRTARIFAVYTLNGGRTSSSDPSARTDVFPGRLFVFIKYGTDINEDSDRDFILDAGEDKNSDGRLNLDIYEVRSFYRIGEKQLLQDNFRLQFFRENKTLSGTEISGLGRYVIDYSEGMIMFNLREPFRKLLGSRAGNIYCANQPANVYLYSQYNIRADYYRESRSFQLKHVNIIPDSVRVKINGRELQMSLYTVDYTSGFFEFTSPDNPVIADDTEIEIKYEYLPLGSQPKTLIAGLRSDYKVNRNLNIGGTVLFTRDSGTEMIPTIGEEPGQTLLLEADTTLHMTEGTLKKIVKEISGNSIKSAPLEINAYAEYAQSHRKVNTFGKALIDDMETAEEAVPVSMSEKDWTLSSMPSGIAGTGQGDRGKIFYYFYRNPSNPDKLRGTGFTPYSVQYSVKPGPYNVATGHIPDSIQDIDSQRSLVFNFDFSSGDYVPVVTKKISADAEDFSGLQYVEIWYRSQGGEGEAELFLDVGSINEDSDGDGILDTEDINNNGFLDFDPGADIEEDLGYLFNPEGEDATVIGSGPKLSKYTAGDGTLNSEDLDNNGTLDTSESILRIPGDGTYPNNSLSPLIINLNNTEWRKARIYLDRSSAEYISKKETLKNVKSVRMFLKKRGAAERGTIYIDSIKFVSMNWREEESNGAAETAPDEFRATKIDTLNDSDYRAESYMLFSNDNYESLHGEMDSDELRREKETALQIEYCFSTPKSGSVIRKLQKNIDIRFYKTLNLWFDFKEYSEGDTIGVRIGSGENDYLEYNFPMQYPGVWKEISLKLTGSSGGEVPILRTVGSPDMKRVNYFKITVNGKANGKIWINDIYVSEPETLKDRAYWYEGEIKFKRPAFYTDSGTPVFSDFNIKYIRKGHGAQFSTIGQTVKDMSEDQNQIFSEVSVLPNWIYQMDFIAEKSETDSLNEEVIDAKRGRTEKRNFNFVSDYSSDTAAVPSIKLAYKQDGYDNRRSEYLADFSVNKNTESSIHNPSLIINEKIYDFLSGDISTMLTIDAFFKKEKINRGGSEETAEAGSLFTPEEIENRQKGGANIIIDYQNKYFFIKPSADGRTHEIVKLEGKESLSDTGINGDVESSYHIPFIYNKNFKFVERDKKGILDFGLKDAAVVTPVFHIELSYFDNGFRDYDGGIREYSGKFTRSKDAKSLISNRIELPLNPGRFVKIDYFKSMTFSWTRSLNLEEKGVPYEGEKTSAFDEEYGLSKQYNEFAGACLNLYKYPPWHFFRGRDNYANGRDFAYKKSNSGITFPEGAPAADYNNTLRLLDNFSIGAAFDFEKFTATADSGVSHTSERQNIRGIPIEMITLNWKLDTGFDLMRIFSLGFFRPNKIGAPYHSANINLGYGFTRNMLITSNIEENSNIPSIGITFKRDRASAGTKFLYEYKKRNKREYISLDEDKRDERDDIYVDNMQNLLSFREVDKTYTFSVFYETDVKWLFDLFSKLYTLAAYPIFFLEYSLILNKYDYTETVSPEPYDQHLITGKLTMDLHKNVQGGITGRWALEKFRNRDTDGISREIRSYEIGMNFTLLF